MIPLPGQTSLNFADFIILLGVIQGTILSVNYFFQKGKKNLYSGLLFLSFTLILLEIFLNRTGYMYKLIWLVDFSEPLQFVFAPLVYLIIVYLHPNAQPKHKWMHFIPFFIYTALLLPFLLQDRQFKLESYFFIHHHVEWNLSTPHPWLEKLGYVRKYQLQIAVLQIAIYLVLQFQLIKQYQKEQKQNKIPIAEIRWWQLFLILMFFLVVVIIFVKLVYFRDLGDHIIASFITLIIYITTIHELGKSFLYGGNPKVTPVVKYESSGLKDDKKDVLCSKLNQIMNEQKLYRDNLLNIAKLARIMGEPPYVVSQVINERMQKTFFEWIAFLRVEEAKVLLKDEKESMVTVEEIAEKVGYNSKSAFNKSFRKYTGKTPSQFRDNL